MMSLMTIIVCKSLAWMADIKLCLKCRVKICFIERYCLFLQLTFWIVAMLIFLYVKYFDGFELVGYGFV